MDSKYDNDIEEIKSELKIINNRKEELYNQVIDLKTVENSLETELKITEGILKDAGISDRKVLYRALNYLEKTKAIATQRHRGRRPIVQLLAKPKGKG